MKRNKLIALVLLFFGLLVLSPMVHAQTPVERSTQITKVGGKEYYMHLVKAGQTLYSIATAYNVTIEEIELYNPEVKDGLKSGHVLGIPVRPLAEPQPEPQPEPKPTVEPKPEPRPEPVIEPEPVVEPEPQPVVEPKPEPVIEPTPEPVVEPEPQPEPQPEPKPVVKPTVPAGQVVTEHRVQMGEDLYDIAKKYGIDLIDFKRINPGLTNEPAVGTSIAIPAIANDNEYILHYCERNEKVASLLKRWKVEESDFRTMNVSVGSHVFENQVVLIPIEPITEFYWVPNLTIPEEPIEVDEEEPEAEISEDFQAMLFDEELERVPECRASSANASRRYKVALMVPLYLNNIGGGEVTKEKAQKGQKSRAMSFLQFYEGFMMAVDNLERQGLKMDLTVVDVTDDIATAERAVNQIRDEEMDMIIGPFFAKSFAVVEEYAEANNIIVVNPMSARESVIDEKSNVVKVRPGKVGLIITLSNLIRNHYPNATVSIVSREKSADSLFLCQLEYHLSEALNGKPMLQENDLLQFARDESARQDADSVTFSVGRYSYSEVGKMKSHLKGGRDNVIIAYGDDNVFATQMLNTLSRTADQMNITLVCLTDWHKFEKLLVDNLLRMHAIYVSTGFIDYNDDDVKHFIMRFRSKYVTDPQRYAFEGYDVGFYFLSALMQYGTEDLLDCLHCYSTPLLHTQYIFPYKNYLDLGGTDGKENIFWTLYQYDKESIELKRINPFEKE